MTVYSLNTLNLIKPMLILMVYLTKYYLKIIIEKYSAYVCACAWENVYQQKVDFLKVASKYTY